MTVALVRPGGWNLPLFLHLLGATTLVGALATVVVLGGASWRGASAATLERVPFATLLALGWPGWILLRVAGGWLESREDVRGSPTWLGAGFVVADGGLVLLLAATALAWLWRRNGARWAIRTTTAVAGLYLAAVAVAWWLMAAKPT